MIITAPLNLMARGTIRSVDAEKEILTTLEVGPFEERQNGLDGGYLPIRSKDPGLNSDDIVSLPRLDSISTCPESDGAGGELCTVNLQSFGIIALDHEGSAISRVRVCARVSFAELG